MRLKLLHGACPGVIYYLRPHMVTADYKNIITIFSKSTQLIPCNELEGAYTPLAPGVPFRLLGRGVSAGRFITDIKGNQKIK
jgi:hypothetical protein